MSRHWCVTLFNPPAKLDDVVQKHPHFKYMVYQSEEAPETKKEHLQGYIEFDCVERVTALQELFGKGNHFEKRHGSREQARQYCMKEESRMAGSEPTELGEWVPDKGKGKRTDLEDTCEVLKTSGIKRAIIAAPHMYVKYANNMEKLGQFYTAMDTQFRKIEVNVLVGPAGCGKTRSVWENEAFDDVYPLTTYGKGRTWFQGYMGEKVLLIDDFNGQIEYTELLRLLDGYKMYIETKGGSALAQWTKVYITSNYPWKDWYAGNYNLDALARRITRVKDTWAAAAAAPVVIDLTNE